MKVVGAVQVYWCIKGDVRLRMSLSKLVAANAGLSGNKSDLLVRYLRLIPAETCVADVLQLLLHPVVDGQVHLNVHVGVRSL